MHNLESAFGGSEDTTIEVWSQLDRFIRLRTRVVAAESRRRKELHEMIAVDRVWALVAALVASVRRHVQDGPKMKAIQADFRELTGRPDPGTVKT